MSEELRERGRALGAHLIGLPEADRIRIANEGLERATEEHKRFVESFESGMCYICGHDLSSFSKKRPCLHWLLRPKGFKKKDFLAVAEAFGFFRMQTWLRWVANTGGFARNINDLNIEGSGGKLFELTIRHKRFEWAFSCDESDFLGHQSSQHSKHPHYHFQMRDEGRPFINYSDFHAPLLPYEVAQIEAMRQYPGQIKPKFHFGEGMNDVFTEEVVEKVLNSPGRAEDESEALLSVSSLAFAEEGKTMRGEDIMAAIEESRRTGVSVASLLKNVPNVGSVKTMVEPGHGVVEQAPRKGGR